MSKQCMQCIHIYKEKRELGLASDARDPCTSGSRSLHVVGKHLAPHASSPVNAKQHLSHLLARKALHHASVDEQTTRKSETQDLSPMFSCLLVTYILVEALGFIFFLQQLFFERKPWGKAPRQHILNIEVQRKTYKRES